MKQLGDDISDFERDWITRYGTVRLEGQEHPFLVWPGFCGDPICDCEKLQLRVTELLPEGLRARAPRKLDVSVGMDRFVEIDPPRRPAEERRLVADVLRSLSPQAREALAEELAPILREKRQATRFKISSQEIRQGTCVPYLDVFSPTGGPHGRGRVVAWRFDLGTRPFAAVDAYCMNPQCDCREATIHVFERERDVERAASTEVCLLSVGLGGRLKAVREEGRAGAPEARRLHKQWRRSAGRELSGLLKARYDIMKRLGERKLREAGEARPAPQTRPRKVGRNAPCPCGSGKKYKACCLPLQTP
jgi:hypothetical protein